MPLPQVARHQKKRYEKLNLRCPCGRRTVGEVRFFETDTIIAVVIAVVNYGHEWRGLKQESCLWILGADNVWRRMSWPGRCGNL